MEDQQAGRLRLTTCRPGNLARRPDGPAWDSATDTADGNSERRDRRQAALSDVDMSSDTC